MMYDETAQFQILSDGKVVWVNAADGCCVGRFAKSGIDIHHTGEVQVSLGEQCLDCRTGPCGADDWIYFQNGMMKAYGLAIGDEHRPLVLA